MAVKNNTTVECLNLGLLKVTKPVLDKVNQIMSGWLGYYTSPENNVIINLEELRNADHPEFVDDLNEALEGFITIPSDESGVLNYLELYA